MLNRTIEVQAKKESGLIGEVRREDGHTFINNMRLTIHVFQLNNRFEKIPGTFYQTIHMDEKELEAFLAYNIRQRESFYAALDQLTETERNDIIGGYFKREKK